MGCANKESRAGRARLGGAADQQLLSVSERQCGGHSSLLCKSHHRHCFGSLALLCPHENNVVLLGPQIAEGKIYAAA